MDGIRIKDDVRFDPRTVGKVEFWKMTEAVQATSPMDYYATITAGCDGKHKAESKHYLGWAKDYRIWDIPGVVIDKISDTWICSKGLELLEAWVRRIQARLGNLYTVLLEVNKVHIHIQYNGG